MQHARSVSVGTHTMQRKSAMCIRPRYDGASSRALSSCPPRPRPYEVTLFNPGTSAHKAWTNVSLAASANDNVNVPVVTIVDKSPPEVLPLATMDNVSIEEPLPEDPLPPPSESDDPQESGTRGDMEIMNAVVSDGELNKWHWRSASMLQNRSGEPVLVFQHESAYTRMLLQELSLKAEGGMTSGGLEFLIKRLPTAVPEAVHMTILENGQDEWYYKRDGKTVTIRSYGDPSQYHAANRPLPGFGRKLVITGTTSALPADD